MNYLEINNQEIKNICLLTGDSFLIKQTILAIAKKMQVNAINISTFNDENFDALACFNACNQFSFFNEKRIIVIDNLLQELKTADKNLIANYTQNPNKDCVLLIVDNNGIFGFIKDIQKIDCKPSDIFLQEYVKKEFAKFGKEISTSLCNKLIEYCSKNLGRITIEIKKLCDYLGDDGEVSDQLIEQMVAKDIELKVFDLTNALAQKDVQKSHKILYEMLKSEEPPIKILGLISGFFRRMFFAKINKDSDENLAKELNCKPYAITMAKKQANGFTAKELKNIHNLILETDYNIKSGQMTQENALYYLIMKITLKNQ